jgi:hypothetical protein
MSKSAHTYRGIRRDAEATTSYFWNWCLAALQAKNDGVEILATQGTRALSIQDFRLR